MADNKVALYLPLYNSTAVNKVNFMDCWRELNLNNLQNKYLSKRIAERELQANFLHETRERERKGRREGRGPAGEGKGTTRKRDSLSSFFFFLSSSYWIRSQYINGLTTIVHSDAFSVASVCTFSHARSYDSTVYLLLIASRHGCSAFAMFRCYCWQ